MVEYHDFTSCWPEDELSARGLVAQVRGLVDHKDSVTVLRRKIEDDAAINRAVYEESAARKKARRQKIDELRRRLNALIIANDPHARGTEFEEIMNDIFATFEVLIKRSFRRVKEGSNTTLEQIDGAVEFDSHIYLVEYKWHNAPLGVEHVQPHISKLYTRADISGIVVSASGYTIPAVETCRDALQQKTVILCTLQEIILLLEREGDLLEFLRDKVRAAHIDRQPFTLILA